MNIEDLGLSVRGYNAVKRYGINTTEELADRIDEFCKHSSKYGAEAREALSKMSAPQSPGVIVESAEYTRAVRLHRCICANAQAAQESLYEMCKALKEMRDSRLYKELGYSELNDYCKSELGMSDRTAYKYISIAENFAADDNLVKSSSLIGREKLALLAKLDALAGEVADVLIMAQQMRFFLGENKVDKEIEFKLDRQIRRINDEKECS